MIGGRLGGALAVAAVALGFAATDAVAAKRKEAPAAHAKVKEMPLAEAKTLILRFRHTPFPNADLRGHMEAMAKIIGFPQQAIAHG